MTTPILIHKFRPISPFCYDTGGSPLGYFDWNTLGQASLSGLESAVMFGAAAVAIDYCHDREIISRFR